jgi:hypothetical protein
VQLVPPGLCRRRVLARVVLLWLALVEVVSAEPRSEAGLIWQAPLDCPDVGEVRARIERRLGAPLESVVHGVEVEVAPDGDGNQRRFVARIDLRSQIAGGGDPDGSAGGAGGSGPRGIDLRAVTVANEVRVLTSARCDELTDAVAVVIARIASERLAAEHAESVRVATHELPAPAPRLWGGGMRALGVSGVGAMPGIGLGGELAAYLRRRSLFLELAGARWLPSSRALSMGGPDRVDISLFVAMVRFGWGPERLPLRGWISGEIGSMYGRGGRARVLDGPGDSARWVGFGGGFGVAWPMSRHTRLIGFVEAVLPLQRARFVLEQGAAVYRPDIATARCGFGLEVGWR